MKTLLILTVDGKILMRRTGHPFFRSFETLRLLIHGIIKKNAPLESFVHDGHLILIRRHWMRWRRFFHVWTLEICPSCVSFYHMNQLLEKQFFPACLTNHHGKILSVNLPLIRALGYEGKDLLDKPFMHLFHQAPNWQDHWAGKIYGLKSRHGQRIDMMISHTLNHENFSLIGFFPADMVTLTAGNWGWLNRFPMPAALLDDHGSISMMNELLGQKFRSYDGGHLAQWVSEKDRYHFAQQLRLYRKSGEASGKIPLHLRHKEGELLWVSLRYIQDDEKIPTGRFLALFHFDEVSAREAEPQKMQLLGQLVSGIIHDFNNLLTGILGFCDLLLQRHRCEDASYKDVQQIKQSAVRATRLIQQLLAFSKSVPMSSAVIWVRRCLRELFPLIHRMVGPKILLTLKEEGENQGQASLIQEDVAIYGDIGQLEQVLLNLSINARDAMSKGGVLTFGVSSRSLKKATPVMKNVLEPQDYVVIEIQDTGTGIDSHHLDRIFDPFFSTKDPGQGTGLGLSNVLQIMEHFGGGVHLETKVGKGTTFFLFFPKHISLASEKLSEAQGVPLLKISEKSLLPNSLLKSEKKDYALEKKDPKSFSSKTLLSDVASASFFQENVKDFLGVKEKSRASKTFLDAKNVEKNLLGKTEASGAFLENSKDSAKKEDPFFPKKQGQEESSEILWGALPFEKPSEEMEASSRIGGQEWVKGKGKKIGSKGLKGAEKQPFISSALPVGSKESEVLKSFIDSSGNASEVSKMDKIPQNQVPKPLFKEKERPKILLVEDEDPIRLFAARALRAQHYQVIEARDGIQALHFIDSEKDLDMMVTDVMMPGVDGPSLALELSKQMAHVKILFVSGYPEEEVRSGLSSSLKEIYFLQKPFSLTDLVEKIGDILSVKKG